MDDDAFHYMMEHHNSDLFDDCGEIQDQIFYCQDVLDTNRKEKCKVQPLGDLLTQNPMEGGIQSTREPVDCPEINSTNAEKGTEIGSDQSDESLFFDIGCGVTCEEDFKIDTEYAGILKEESITSNNNSDELLNEGIDQQAKDDLIQDYFMAMTLHPELYDETILRDIYMNRVDLSNITEQKPRELCSSMDDPGNPKTLEAMPADQSMSEKFEATQDDCPSMPETSVVIPSNLSSETSKEEFTSQRSANSAHCEMGSKDSILDTNEQKGIDWLSRKVGVSLNDSLFCYNDEFFGCSSEAEQSHDKIWSILTTDLCYINVDDNNLSDGKLKPKVKFFNADHSNKPCNFIVNESIIKGQDKWEHDKFNLSITLEPQEKFNPSKHISSTYLWTQVQERINKPQIRTIQESWFPEGSFSINATGETVGYLLDGSPIKIKTLMDSGATKAMLNRKTYEKHKELQKYPKFKIKPRKIVFANDETIIIDECISLIITFEGHVFEIIAYLVNATANYDFFIGHKAMYELEGGPNFGTLSFNFMIRSIPIIAQEDVTLQPGEKYNLRAKLLKVPTDFKSGKIICKFRSNYLDVHSINTQVVYFDAQGGNSLLQHNRTSYAWTIRKGEILGCADMRSIGYFHIRRNMLQTELESKELCNFLSDSDTVDYFNLLIEDHNQVTEIANTKLKERELDKLDRKDSNKASYDEEHNYDKYPWLEKDDPRRHMSDIEIIDKYVNLSESELTLKEKRKLKQVILKYRQAFSLRDEIGLCPHMEVELELTDTTPFFIRPFPIKEGEKDIIDKEMKKGCLLGILKKGMSSYSSPIMLIPRKQGGIPRIVTDFRHLNSRLVTLHPSIPLVRDAIQILGNSGCEIISVIDLRDAYHTLRLSKKSQKFCGITPYYGSDTYLYQRLGMGLSVSPAVWQNFIQKVLSEIPNHRKHHLAIMDDCLVHSRMKDHLHHLIDLFKALIRNGLKISPKKCQLFRKKLVYMGHTLLIQDGRPQITPLKTRTEAILKLDPPKTVKNCKQFCGMVNFLSIFLKDLQLILAPIYQLTKKGIPFVWSEECETAFKKIKKALTSPPVLAMPNEQGHFILVSDTSIVGCGATLYQEQDGDYRVIAYYSKKLPEAVRRYSISELELTGILANITAFKHVLRNIEFTVFCDHSALVHIINAKREPPTLRLQKLVENLMNYKFKIKFQKGKELHVTDFLSRHPDNDLDSPNEIIPIAFMAKDIQTEWPEKVKEFKDAKIFSKHNCDVCNMMTRSKTKGIDTVVPKMYPLKGDHKKPEVSKEGIIEVKPRDKLKMIPKVILHDINKGNKGQDGKDVVDLTSKATDFPTTNLDPNPIPIPVPMPHPSFLKGRDTTENIINQQQNDKVIENQQKQLQQQQLINPLPLNVRLVGRLPAFNMEKELASDNWIISEQDKNRELIPLFKKGQFQIIRKTLPKQLDLTKFLKQLDYKVIHDYKIPISVKELRAEYSTSAFFKDIYKYKKTGIAKTFGRGNLSFKKMCEDYFLIEGVLFKTKYDQEPTAVLCIPEKYVPVILYQYHDEILAGHPGVQKLMATISKKYYFPGMHTLIREYVISCLECQSMKQKLEGKAIHFPRIPLDFRPMARFSMDIKHMPPSSLGYSKMLVCTCEFSNWIVAIPIINEQASTIAEALFFKIICQFGTPKAIICDEAPAFTSELMMCYFHALNVKPIYVSPGNHGSNRTERYIRTLSEILTKYLTDTGLDWPMYVAPACFAMNTQVSLVTKFSPYEVVYLQPPPDLFNFDFDPDKSGIKIETARYMEHMKQKREDISKLVYERKRIEAETRYIQELRKYPDELDFKVGDFVFFNYEGGSVLHAPSKKFKRSWIGPLKIHQVLDETHFILSDWDERLLSPKIHINRIKRYYLNLRNIKEDGHLEVITNVHELYDRWKELMDKENDLNVQM